MNTPEIVAALAPIVETLEELGVAYHIGGSVASSVHGIPRLTIDADIVADLRLEHIRSPVNMQRWAKALQVTDLLERALVEAGMS